MEGLRGRAQPRPRCSLSGGENDGAGLAQRPGRASLLPARSAVLGVTETFTMTLEAAGGPRAGGARGKQTLDKH